MRKQSWILAAALAALVGCGGVSRESARDRATEHGCDRLEARVVTSAVLAALTSALLWWAAEDQADLSDAIERALGTLHPHSSRASR